MVYACAALALLLTTLLILANALPALPVLRWIHHGGGSIFVLSGMALVLGLLALLLARARNITLMHLTAIHHSLDAILFTHPDGRILSANPAACELFGYSAAEIKAGGRDMLTYPDDPEIEALLKKRLAQGTLRCELWLRHRSGRRIRAEVSNVVFDFRGEQRTAMIIRDIGQTRQSEYEHRIAQAVYSDESQAVGVYDHEWRMIWMNHATERMSGYSRSEMIGKPPPLQRHLETEEPEKLAKIRATLERKGHWTGEINTRRKNGEMYPLYGSLTRIESPVPDHPHYVATFSDVSSLRDYERKLRKFSQFDPITTLPNRTLFEEKVQQSLGHADPATDILALLLVDIDGFRNINESLGHETGDRMLLAAARRLLELAGRHALVGRHAGDSFAVLIEGMTDVEEAGLVASTIVSGFHSMFESAESRIHMTVGIGLACFPDEGSSVADLLRHAEIALGKAKQAGGDSYRLYEAGAERDAQRFVALAAEIRNAIESDAFVANFQPILDVSARKVTAMEALARWPRPGLSPIGPADFIPVAERSGLIAHLSEIMLRQSCRHLRKLNEAGFPNLRVTVNLSARQFRDSRLAERIFAVLDDEGTSPTSIVLEITESLLMDKPGEKQRMLERLQAGGVHVVMDDFGTGYSSLGYLKNFNLDGIKMDGSFTRNLPHNPKDAAIVRTILAIGHELDLPVVAEGVENAEQARFLTDHGCPRLQGNYIGKPMSSADFLAFLRKSRRDSRLRLVGQQ